MVARRSRVHLFSVISLLLIFSLLFAACGGNKESNSAASPSSNAGSNSASAGASASSGQEKPAEPIAVTLMRYEHPSQAVVSDSVAVQEILKRKNVKIDLQSVPQSNYNDKKKTLIATNTIPDIIQVNQSDLSSFADSGVFLDLTPYLESGKMPNLAEKIKQFPDVNKTKVDGKLYGFPMLTHWNFYNGQLPMIRTDLLTELSLQPPATYEELYQVLKKLKEAYPDSYPFTSRAANGKNGTQGLINPIAFGFGSGYTNITGLPIYYEPKEDQYKFGPFASEFKDAIAYLNKLYTEKLLDPDYTVSTSQIWQEKLSSGKSFFFMDNTGFAVNFMSALQQTDSDAQFDILPALTSSNGVKRTQLFNLHNMSELFAISSSTKHPDELVGLLDWMYSDEGTMLLNNGIEGVHHTIKDGVPTPTADFFEEHKDKQDPLRSMHAELGGGYLGLGLNYDFSFAIATSPPDRLRWSNLAQSQIEESISFPEVNDPPFNEEERDKLKQLITKVDAHLTQNLDKYIITKGAIDKDWDAFVKQLEQMGAQEIADIYNAAYQRIK